MIRVSNKSCLRRLGWQAMKAARVRNLVAVVAIALTTVLFTSLFTIALSINDGFQQSNFRQVGGTSHGGFKYLTQEQADQLKDDPLIEEYGLRRFLGMPTEVPFNKSHVELGYSDANQAKWMFCDPVEGRLPQEGTDEAATDTRVLELLGVEPVLGATFTIPFQVAGQETTQTFTLCGWWEYDEASTASHVLLPQSRVDQVLQQLAITPPAQDGMTGSWNMDVMLDSALHIEEDLNTILTNHGYQSQTKGENFIDIGVNWGYTGAKFSENLDPATVLAIAALLVLIIFTGYLIIYNVFQISVTNDIRFYGLLKTIGTTGRQIKALLRQQALLLSLLGIPIGLVLGWLVGGQLTPVVISRLDGVVSVVSLNPWIFVGATLFSLLTVLLSCAKPGRMAAKVSPIEAVRYTEGSGMKKKEKKSGGISLRAMASANLSRSKGKTVVTVLSLALAVVLTTVTATFVSGFDMDKYLSSQICTDFVLADAAHFQTGGEVFNPDQALPQEIIDRVAAQGGVTESGKVYGRTTAVQEFVTEEYFRHGKSLFNSEEQLDSLVHFTEKNDQGLLADTAQLYGMEEFARRQLTVLEGDLSKLDQPGGNYVAAVYSEDDYGKAKMDSHWARVGDTITLRYVTQWEFFDPNTGEIYPEGESIPETVAYAKRAVEYRDVSYEVAALVTVPHCLDYGYYGNDEFVLNDQTFCRDTGTANVMLYAFNTADASVQPMESFLADYTENQAPSYDYISRATYQAEFEGFRAMFLMLGGALSFIVGLVGVLNFFNAILTGILARKREFAVLQSIGMTGRQLKGMLVWEGLFYALGAVLLALVLALVLGPLSASALERMFWFFTYRLTLTPIGVLLPIFAALGVLIPLAVYRVVAKASVVERLRQAES